MMMPKKFTFTSKLKSQSGALAVDFIFAFTLIFGFTLILFSFALTLTAVEMTQYLTYTAARAHFASHFTLTQQKEQAAKKYDALLETEGYSFLNNNSWFEIGDRFIGNIQGHPDGKLKTYLPSGGDPNRFEGVVVQFYARILAMSSPFFGSTEPSGDGTGSTFNTRIASYLSREPTMEECEEFLKARYDAVMDLKVKGGGASYSQAKSHKTYDAVYIMDNGC